MIEKLLDWVYPRKCALCGLFDDHAVCEVCRSEFVPLPRQPHLGSTPLAYRVSLYRYESRAAQAVKRLKYARVTSLVVPLATMMREGYEACELTDVDAIVPIPIHWSRRAARGFNQATYLCRLLPREKIDERLIRRIRPTRPQVSLTPDERRRNLIDAFRASPQAKGRHILLVDDVTTSGCTAELCAQALIDVGAGKVGLLTLCGDA